MRGYSGEERLRRAGGRGKLARLALSLAVVLLLFAVAAGCGTGSSRGSGGSGAESGGSGSAKATGPQETIQGTTSKGPTSGASSTVGTVPSGTSDSGSGVQGGADGSADNSAPSAGQSGQQGEVSAEQSGQQGGQSAASVPSAPARTPQTQTTQTQTTQTRSPEASTSSQGGSGGDLQNIVNPGEFVAAPEDSGGNGYAADSILGVRFGDHQGYERVVVDLGSGGKPTGGIPNWTLSSPTGDGRLKLSFPSVRNTAVSDGSLEKAGAELLDSFYVVRGPDGGMFVDFFAKRAFYYRVIELPNPSRIAIDFKASGADLAIPLPIRKGNTVLTQPRRGSGITSPMTVSGYSRNQGASNTIVLQGPGGKTLARETVLSNDWASTWGYFETSLDFQPFAGEGLLKVGTQSARDGSFQGVELPVKNAR